MKTKFTPSKYCWILKGTLFKESMTSQERVDNIPTAEGLFCCLGGCLPRMFKYCSVKILLRIHQELLIIVETESQNAYKYIFTKLKKEQKKTEHKIK